MADRKEAECEVCVTNARLYPMTEAFSQLSPERILDAIDEVLGAPDFALGWRCSGQVLALNSYENRVFQVALEACGAGAPDLIPGLTLSDRCSLVTKFYRPARWTNEQIQEEHDFLQELVQAEVPAVPALVLEKRTLHEAQGFRLALFPKRGGRSPEVSDPQVRERLGRFLGRLHAVGAQSPFEYRATLSAHTFGREPARFLLENHWLPPGLQRVYSGLVDQALDLVDAAFDRVPGVIWQRTHGDCHMGNVLWHDDGPEPGPYFLDFDDAVMAPAIQDLWMLLSGSQDEMAEQMRVLLRGYEDFREFDERELILIEPLRTLRLVHYAAWVARRWSDPAFPAAFPWFEDARYWEARILELREQIAAMQDEPLRLR